VGVQHALAEGLCEQGVRQPRVAVFYRLDTPVALAPVAEWYRVRDGKIVELRAYFDARPFAPLAGKQAGQ
jgi:limonene-1,2-epoxide hydrolase